MRHKVLIIFNQKAVIVETLDGWLDFPNSIAFWLIAYFCAIEGDLYIDFMCLYSNYALSFSRENTTSYRNVLAAVQPFFCLVRREFFSAFGSVFTETIHRSRYSVHTKAFAQVRKSFLFVNVDPLHNTTPFHYRSLKNKEKV